MLEKLNFVITDNCEQVNMNLIKTIIIISEVTVKLYEKEVVFYLIPDFILYKINLLLLPEKITKTIHKIRLIWIFRLTERGGMFPQKKEINV